jgi:hypothetical protein
MAQLCSCAPSGNQFSKPSRPQSRPHANFNFNNPDIYASLMANNKSTARGLTAGPWVIACRIIPQMLV